MLPCQRVLLCSAPSPWRGFPALEYYARIRLPAPRRLRMRGPFRQPTDDACRRRAGAPGSWAFPFLLCRALRPRRRSPAAIAIVGCYFALPDFRPCGLRTIFTRLDRSLAYCPSVALPTLTHVVAHEPKIDSRWSAPFFQGGNFPAGKTPGLSWRTEKVRQVQIPSHSWPSPDDAWPRRLPW